MRNPHSAGRQALPQLHLAALTFAIVVLSAAFAHAVTPEQLIEKAHRSHVPFESEAQIRKALKMWENSGDVETPQYANALVLLALLATGRDQDQPATMAADVGPMVEHAIGICEKHTCTEDTFPLALEMESRVFHANADDDQARAAASHAFHLRGLPDAPRPNPPDSPATSGIYRVGGGVKPPSVTYKRDPDYSEAARWAHLTGIVLLQVVVNADGKPKVLRVVRALGFGLDEKALEAVSHWRFRPGEKDGTPVAVMANIEVHFRLL